MPAIPDRRALSARREAARAGLADRARNKTLVNVSCGTCGIASGAERVLEVMREAVRARGLDNVLFIRSGCMTYCYAEPTVSVTRAGEEAVTFGFVDEKCALALVNDFIARGEPVDGEISVAYERVIL